MNGVVVKCEKHWGNKVEYIHYNMIFQQLKYTNIYFDSLRNVQCPKLIQGTIHIDGVKSPF